MKRTTYPYLLADFYDASQFEMINFANVNMVPFLLKHTLEIEFGPGQFS